jgi:hypothetical protein
MEEYETDIGLLRLMNEASEAAERFRGHVLEWEQLGPHLVRGACVVCGMEVDYNALPMPNEIDIGGGAVAVNCPGVGSSTHRAGRAVLEEDADLENLLGGGPPGGKIDDDGDDGETDRITVAWVVYDVLVVRLSLLKRELPIVHVRSVDHGMERKFRLSPSFQDARWLPVQEVSSDVADHIGFVPAYAWPIG